MSDGGKSEEAAIHDAYVYILGVVFQISTPAGRLAFLGSMETFIGSLENMFSVTRTERKVAKDAAPKRTRGRPRKSRNGGEAEAPASVE